MYCTSVNSLSYDCPVFVFHKSIRSCSSTSSAIHKNSSSSNPGSPFPSIFSKISFIFLSAIVVHTIAVVGNNCSRVSVPVNLLGVTLFSNSLLFSILSTSVVMATSAFVTSKPTETLNSGLISFSIAAFRSLSIDSFCCGSNLFACSSVSLRPCMLFALIAI